MTVASILDIMNVLDNELDVSSGGADESRAIAAAAMAQRLFEARIANVQNLLGTVSSVSTTANQATTTWPSTLMRLDQMWLLDANSNQRWKINIIQEVGGQTPQAWPLSLGFSTGTGAPTAAFTNRANFYWDRTPDAVYVMRTYGLYQQTALSTRAQTFAYPDHVADPMAAVAVQCMEMGIDDPSAELEAFADKHYVPVLKMLKQPVRQRPVSRQYAEVHYT